jgi:tungstate ABC transporter binding protein WtpA
LPSLLPVLLALLVMLAGCARGDAPRAEMTVFAAGSLARPLRAALDSISAAGGATVRLEIMGSRELLRAVTSLGRTPDLIVSADAEELEQALIPTFVASSTTFATNRVVLALSPKSALSPKLTAMNWADIVAGGSLRIARADPARAPLGYRTQLVWQLAERALVRPGLAARLAAAGFTDIEVEPTRIYTREDAAEIATSSACCGGDDAEQSLAALDGAVMSAFIRAKKPSAS